VSTANVGGEKALLFPPKKAKGENGRGFDATAPSLFWHKVCCLKSEGIAEGGMSRGKNFVFAGSGNVFVVFFGIGYR